MMPHYHRLLPALLLTFLPLAVTAQTSVPPSPAPSAVTLRYKFAVGQIMRYSVKTSIIPTVLPGQSGAEIPPNTITEIILRKTVKAVRASDGAATLEQQIESMQCQINGKTVVMPSSQAALIKKPVTSLMMPDGKAAFDPSQVFPSGGIGGMNFPNGFKFSSIAFPDHPVKRGETWSGMEGTGGKGMKMAVALTLTALDLSQTHPCVTIHQKIVGSMDMSVPIQKNLPVIKVTAKMNGAGTQIFDLQDGDDIHEQISMDIDMLMDFVPPPHSSGLKNGPQVIRMKMTEILSIDRLKDAPTAPTLAQ